MKDKKSSFWMPFLLSLAAYFLFRVLRYLLNLYLGVAAVFTGVSLLSFVSVLAVALYITGSIVTVRKWGNIYAFPAGVVVVEVARDIKQIVKCFDLVSSIRDSAETVSWIEEWLMRLIDSIGLAGQIMYSAYCLFDSAVFFAVLLGLTALTKLIFSLIDKKNKKADNDTIIINDMEEKL